MAEELPQNPSGSQEATKQSRAIVEEQPVTQPTETNIGENIQDSQAQVNQLSQSNKKHDLGVLFVHGIGKQCRGDTFKGMYYPIIDELKSQNISLNEISINDNSAITIVSRDNSSKSILFQESHWNNFQPSNQKKGGGKSTPALKAFFAWIVNAIQCIFWIIYFLSLSAIEKMCNKKLTVFSTMLSAVYLFLFFMNVFNKNANTGKPSVFDDIARVFVILLYGSLIFLLPKLQESSPGELFRRIFSRDALKVLIFPTAVFVVTPVVYAYRNDIYRIISNPSVVPYCIGVSILVAVLLIFLFCKYCADYVAYLWNQINVSAEYVSSGEENEYIEKVKGHIYNLAKKSDKVVIIAHSMGEYLSYNSLGILEGDLRNKKFTSSV